MMEEEKKEQEEGLSHSLKKRVVALKEWVKPDPADPLFLKIVKLIYKSIALLILVALSPVILVILIVIFFATL